MQPYELIRSGRRTLALEVRGGRVIVRAPYRASQAVIDRFVASHAEWIARGLAKQEARAAAHPEPTDAERAAYIRQAKACLPQRVAYYSEQMGLYPTQVRITGARTRCARRWAASISSRSSPRSRRATTPGTSSSPHSRSICASRRPDGQVFVALAGKIGYTI